MEVLEKKYGLWTSIAMVVGVVIGSGVFFKADDVLSLTNGNLILALLAWVLGAMAMIFGALVFAEFACRIQKANGIVDYSEVAYGKRFGYLVGWFNGMIYYSPLSAILAWVSALYTLILFGSENPSNSITTWVLAFTYLVLFYVLNYLSPILAGKLQVTTTVIKLIPLGLIAVTGVIYGLSHETTFSNFTSAAQTMRGGTKSLASAVVASAFAFEGWIVATTINNEIKDAKKTLPKALFIGSLVIFIVYVSYFLGITGVLSTDRIVQEGDNSVNLAATALFGRVAAVILIAFVVVSCLGTLNGLVISCIRTPYSLAIRNQGPVPHLLSKVHPVTKMPLYSVIYAFILSCLYLLIWYGSHNQFFPQFISIDEIPIVLIYGFYILLYIWYMRTFKELNAWKRYGIPTFAIIGALIILYGGITNPSIGLYLFISLIIIAIGLLFYKDEDALEH
jgi:basic amino acid/polyamine antiporter, APA family